MSVYEFGDAQPIVKVCLDADGWRWFYDVAERDLGPGDLFFRDVQRADAIVNPDPEPE